MRVDPDESIVAERIDSGQVEVFQRRYLLNSFTGGVLKFDDANVSRHSEPVYERPVSELPDPIQKELDRRLRYVSAILEEAPSVFTPQTVLPIRDAVSTETNDTAPPSFTTLYRWVRSVSRSETYRSLIPRHERRGPRRSYQPVRVIELFEQAADKAFAVSPQATIKSVHERLSELIEDENALLDGAMALRPKSRSLLDMRALAWRVGDYPSS